jgi:transcription termination factor Rho
VPRTPKNQNLEQNSQEKSLTDIVYPESTGIPVPEYLGTPDKLPENTDDVPQPKRRGRKPNMKPNGKPKAHKNIEVEIASDIEPDYQEKREPVDGIAAAEKRLAEQYGVANIDAIAEPIYTGAPSYEASSENAGEQVSVANESEAVSQGTEGVQVQGENQGEGQIDPNAQQQGENAQAQNGEGQDDRRFNNQNGKFNQNNRFNKNNKFNKNNRNRNSQQEEFVDDSATLPPPGSEVILKAKENWLKFRKLSMSELQELAMQKELDFRRMRKQSLNYILQSTENEGNIIYTEGVLEVTPQGHGFLRMPDQNYQTSTDDVYVSQNLIRKFNLKIGDTIEGLVRTPREQDKYFSMRRIDRVNFEEPDKMRRRVAFEYLTPIHPEEKIHLEWNETEYSTRIMDLFSPIGKGQRSIILAPPRTGKTVLLQNVTRAIAKNHPEIILITLLIDERPEEVTEMRDIITEIKEKAAEKGIEIKAEVVASTFDEPPEHHTRVANMVLEKAKRLVESQKDVVILLDSITRFARANNVVIPHSGKILSGGVDANAMQFPKKFFGAARKIQDKVRPVKNEDGSITEEIQKNGSLTIIGTALIETGSRMDEVIFEEFKGTGNMELVLDRRIAEKRIWPAIDVFKSGTRKEERLLTLLEQNAAWNFRRGSQNETETGIMENLLKLMSKLKTNAELLAVLSKPKV